MPKKPIRVILISEVLGPFKNKGIYPYARIGKFTTHEHHPDYVDLLDLIANLSIRLGRIFINLKKHMDLETNVAQRQIQHMGRECRKDYRKDLNILVERKLIKLGSNYKIIQYRDGSTAILQHNDVMINPFLIIPPNELQHKLMDLWSAWDA